MTSDFLAALRAELARVEAGIRQHAQLADHLRGLLDYYAPDVPAAAASEPEDGNLWRAGLEATKLAPPETPATPGDEIAAVLREAGQPESVDYLVNALAARGIAPAGHRARAVLSGVLSKSPRFHQPLPGRYVLAE